eukprot:TRINITY_DN16231_c0_g3_i2.p1 TRINITY_DN16231_c0_g3~~TRINITY_DN16231_c0_g3_i2.p1  ORF type:complete len:441 (+),score=81.03 TRINITY_DN16231_c0_g3_i2:269-1591(+)
MLVQTASASLAAVQQLERFFTALTTFLRNSGPGRPVLLSKIASSGPVQAEWTVLQRSRAIAPTVKMKQVILQRPHAYRIVTDHRNQPHVVLAAPPPHPLPGTTSPSLLGSTEGGGFDAQPAKSSPGTNGGGPSTGVALDLERMTAIEAHLLRSRGGQDFMSSIVATFGVDAAQVAAHFAVLPLPYGVLSSKKTGSAQVTTSTDALVSANSSGTLGSLAASTSAGVKALDQLLPNLVTERRAVCGLMVFCLDHARDAAAISRRLVASLVELRLSAESVLARLYLISDILFNAATLRAGSSRYVASLQDLLPEAFEQLGRAFLPTLEEPERARVEEKVRSVLIAWKDLEPFPPLYPRGLEALFFAPVLPEVGSLEGLKASADAELRGRLARWLSGAEQVDTVPPRHSRYEFVSGSIAKGLQASRPCGQSPPNVGVSGATLPL